MLLIYSAYDDSSGSNSSDYVILFIQENSTKRHQKPRQSWNDTITEDLHKIGEPEEKQMNSQCVKTVSLALTVDGQTPL